MVGRVLIIDGQATNRIVMKARLAAASYDAVPAADGMAALSLARSEMPDAILVDLDMPGPPCGVEVLRQLRSDRRLGQVPLIGLGAASDAERRIAALDAGADDVMSKPVADGPLLARLRNLMRRPEQVGGLDDPQPWLSGMAEGSTGFERPGLIGILASRPEVALHLRHDLAPLLQHRCVMLNRNDALQEMAEPVPDVFLLEGEPEGTAGTLSLMSDLRSRGPARHAAFCLLRPSHAGAMDALAFDLGAHDVATIGSDPRELALRLGAAMRRKQAVDLHRSHVQTQLRLSVRDPLTGLFNRRYAQNQIVGMAEAARMEGMTYAVILLDLDRFKAVNDRWGHASGDAVLVAVGERLLANIRSGDLLARFGGEEFLVALPGTGEDEAALVADRLRQAINESPFDIPVAPPLRVTASLGIAVGTGTGPVENVISRADRALYASKAGGRDRVTFDRARSA